MQLDEYSRTPYYIPYGYIIYKAQAGVSGMKIRFRGVVYDEPTRIIVGGSYRLIETRVM